MAGKTQIFGHRGSAGTHPENTMVSFQAASDAGADGIELDIQLTKDGIPVIIHDETIDRTTDGTGWVRDFTYEELKEYDAGSNFHKDFKGERIPSLEEFLEWAVDKSLLLNLELKNGIVHYPGLEKIVLRLADKYQLKNRVIISSFNHYSLKEIRKLDQEIETALLFMEGLYEPWNYAKTVEAQGLHCFLPVAVPELLAGAAEARMPVRPFTVNEEKHIDSLIKAGCSAIITDWPEKAVSIRQDLTHSGTD